MTDPIPDKVKILRSTDLFTYEGGCIADQQDILLTLTGQKPVSSLAESDITYENGEKIFRPVDHINIIKLMSQLGLKYSLQDDERYTSIIISLDENLIKKYRDNYLSDKITGELLGFPSTAVDAFIKDADSLMSLEDQEKLVLAENLPESMPNFRLSKAHYKEELEVLKDWYATLLKYDFIS